MVIFRVIFAWSVPRTGLEEEVIMKSLLDRCAARSSVRSLARWLPGPLTGMDRGTAGRVSDRASE